MAVSTHSRPKAAGRRLGLLGFGGLVSTHSRPKAAGTLLIMSRSEMNSFNTQPPEGGWSCFFFLGHICHFVSTHSRPKAAGAIGATPRVCVTVSTHSRPKAAGPSARFRAYARPFQHTAARRRLAKPCLTGYRRLLFQHTAARRRLGFLITMPILNG